MTTQLIEQEQLSNIIKISAPTATFYWRGEMMGETECLAAFQITPSQERALYEKGYCTNREGHIWALSCQVKQWELDLKTQTLKCPKD